MYYVPVHVFWSVKKDIAKNEGHGSGIQNPNCTQFNKTRGVAVCGCCLQHSMEAKPRFERWSASCRMKLAPLWPYSERLFNRKPVIVKPDPLCPCCSIPSTRVCTGITVPVQKSYAAMQWNDVGTKLKKRQPISGKGWYQITIARKYPDGRNLREF